MVIMPQRKEQNRSIKTASTSCYTSLRDGMHRRRLLANTRGCPRSMRIATLSVCAVALAATCTLEAGVSSAKEQMGAGVLSGSSRGESGLERGIDPAENVKLLKKREKAFLGATSPGAGETGYVPLDDRPFYPVGASGHSGERRNAREGWRGEGLGREGELEDNGLHNPFNTNDYMRPSDDGTPFDGFHGYKANFGIDHRARNDELMYEFSHNPLHGLEVILDEETMGDEWRQSDDEDDESFRTRREVLVKEQLNERHRLRTRDGTLMECQLRRSGYEDIDDDEHDEDLEGDDGANVEVEVEVGADGKTTMAKTGKAPETSKDTLYLEVEEQLDMLEGHCLVMNKGWWSYRWCYKQEVRQFHQETVKGTASAGDDKSTATKNAASTKVTADWSLGKFSPKSTKEENLKGEEGSKAYHSHIFTGGQTCDETGQGRTTDVRFFCCDEHSKTLATIQSIEETRLCNYRVVICSPLACHASLASSIAADEESASSLLAPLASSCYHKANGWWTYEFCLNKHARQFHVSITENKKKERVSEVTAEYTLGKYTKKVGKIEKGLLSFDVAYVETYKDGDQCEGAKVKGQTDVKMVKRTTKVIMVCTDPKSSHELLSVVEEATCQYALVFNTPYLCKHPAFVNERKKKIPFRMECSVVDFHKQTEEEKEDTRGILEMKMSANGA